MSDKRVWNPAEGPDADPRQKPPLAAGVSGTGETERSHGGLWTPSEGPVRGEPGGAHGEPDGTRLPIPGRTALNER